MTKEDTLGFIEWTEETFNRTSDGWVYKNVGAPSKDFTYSSSDLYDLYQEQIDFREKRKEYAKEVANHAISHAKEKDAEYERRMKELDKFYGL